MIKRQKNVLGLDASCDIVLDETIATLKKQSRKEKDTDTWEADMNRDAEQYEAEQEADNGT